MLKRLRRVKLFLICLGVFSSIVLSVSVISFVEAQTLDSPNVAALGERYTTAIEGIVPITQPYRDRADIESATLILNGQNIPAQYDPVGEQLVFFPQAEIHLQDGQQQGEILINSRQYGQLRQPIQFNYDNTKPQTTITDEGNLFRVVLEDDHAGIVSATVQGTGITIPTRQTWLQPQQRVEFTVPKTAQDSRIRVMGEQELYGFVQTWQQLQSRANRLISLSDTPSPQPEQGRQRLLDPNLTDAEAITLVDALNTQDYLTGLALAEDWGEIEPLTYKQIANQLTQVWQLTGQKPALVQITQLPGDQGLQVTTVMPGGNLAAKQKPISTALKQQSNPTAVISERELVKNVDPKILEQTLQSYFRGLTNTRRPQAYLPSAQQLYQWLIAPIETQLATSEVDVLLFSMDGGLRSLPLAALHDGKQFLAEKYGIALIPSFGLTHTEVRDIRGQAIMAMGASRFADLAPLPAVPVELQTILTPSSRGETFLNEDFTLENFEQRNRQQRFGIIHLATHSEFRSGDQNNSYIQFFDQRLSLPQFSQVARDLGWLGKATPPVDLLVLSACATAVGDRDAELGFSGLALQAGVKSALASLWYVSDIGTLALMSEFYHQLSLDPVKSRALQKTQLAMLRGEVKLTPEALILSDGSQVFLPESLRNNPIDLQHPYFWSAFTLIGNWN